VTVISAAFQRLAGRTFRDRQIIVRSESGVVARTVRRSHQLAAAGVGFAAVVWIVASAVALIAAGNGLSEREARIAELQREAARATTELAAREAELADFTQRDRDAARVLADLNRELGMLERARQEDRAALDGLAAERDALARDLAERGALLDETSTRRDRLAARLDARTAQIAGLSDERDRLAAELEDVRDALLDARSWNASVGAGFARLGSTVYEAARLVFAGDQPSGLVLALDEAERRIDALQDQRQALIDNAARLWAARNRAVDDRDAARAVRDRRDRRAAESVAARRTIEERLRASFRNAEELRRQRDRLADALGAEAARADAADAARRLAEQRTEEAQAQLASAYRHAGDLWAHGNALTDLAESLAAQLQRARVEAAELRVAQQQFFGEVRARTEAHVAAVEQGLAYTGLDIDALIADDAESDGDTGLGGPLIPALTGRPLNEAVWAEASDIVLLMDRAAALSDVANRLPITNPVQDRYRLSSGFGTRTDPFTGRTARHHGLDFAARRGTPIYATAPGEVVRAGWRGAYGYMVEIEHDFGLATRYAHLSSVLVEVGEEVEYGDRIGLMGSTGRSSGPHLHYEVRVDGNPRNPIRYIRAGQHVLQAAN
jgi:murein DD-endopeptidase MepM/ murein hydrolase activator NlpD